MPPTSQHDDRLFFLHIPKTAGSSFTRVLKSLYREEEIFHKMDPAELTSLLEDGESDHKLYIGHYSYDALNGFRNRPQVLTFLREPRQRVASHYYYYQLQDEQAIEKMPERDRQIVALTKQYSFADFISLDLPEVERAFSNAQTRHLAHNTDDAVPQTTRERQELVTLACSHLDELAFVGIAEEFDISMECFRYRFSTHVNIEPTAVNVNESRPRNTEELEIFDRDEIAFRRIELDRQLYDAGLNLFRQSMRDVLPLKVRLRLKLARSPLAGMFFNQLETLRR